VTNRIKVKAISLRRAEGPHSSFGRECTVQTWSQANMVLRQWSSSAPANGAYDKCDFRIVFDDGSTYEGRYDLEHFSVRSPDLAAHVRGHMNYVAGVPPLWMTSQPDIMATFYREIETCPQRRASAAQARQWLCDYDVNLAA
jgi:hypothetical protein